MREICGSSTGLLDSQFFILGQLPGLKKAFDNRPESSEIMETEVFGKHWGSTAKLKAGDFSVEKHWRHAVNLPRPVCCDSHCPGLPCQTMTRSKGKPGVAIPRG